MQIGVPGAFTPPCSSQVPGYIEKYDEFKAKGVDVIAVVAANDAFVMSGWARAVGLKDKVRPRSHDRLRKGYG